MDSSEFLEALCVPGIYQYGYDKHGNFDTTRSVHVPLVTYDDVAILDMSPSLRESMAVAVA
jgi:hypothetical protein